MPTRSSAIIVEDGELLMLYRTEKAYWELPGRNVTDSETPRTAAVRAAQDAIGCDVQIRSSWGRFDLDFEHDGATYKTRGFIADIVDGAPSPDDERFNDMQWMDADDLVDAALAPNLREIRDHLRLLLLRSS